jgi:hypothetical protein
VLAQFVSHLRWVKEFFETLPNLLSVEAFSKYEELKKKEV